jgi:glucokinase
LSNNKDFILVLDLGGTHFRLGLADREGKLLTRYTALTHAEQGREEVIQRITEAIKRMVSGVGLDAMLGMGIAAAGPLEPETGTLLTPPNLSCLSHTPLKAIFEQELGIPVWLANDASLAALGEHRFGAGRGFSHLLYLTVSTGIGGGAIIDNKLFMGATGLATEFGHMVIDPDGPKCACGNYGCLEALASGSAISRMAREGISSGRLSAILSLADNDLNKITAELVTKAAQSGDPLAKEIMERAGTSLGIGIVNLLHLFEPELVIIGGGVANAGELLFAPMRKVIAERAMPDFRNRVKLVLSALGDASGLYGAVAWVLDKCR